ncbi:hypothetical protein [Aurantiacibacter spongiae]|uniref:Uncharacterized protein n=1 Tax=Aurantiacibacter spongiae TaxID=2488860 RepID=A0A3N5CVL2_9SPHN|nr:hypothetical protein [Aurantiacibacter spongiae]RPF71520.1 hypothetical protein EG799_07755 [Aurantiacibacter spongiae]
MAGLGFGFGAIAASPVWPGGGPGAMLRSLSPAPEWDGIAGSGFTTVPADPVRITAKPVCRLLTPPRQWFTDELVVGVAAAANSGGSLIDNLGMDKVVFHFEGSAVEVDTPGFHTFADVNGDTVTYLGWWVRLKRPVGVKGFANLYVEAIAQDASMQGRVIGPYVFAPQDVVYEGEVTVGSAGGADFATLDEATDHVKARGWRSSLITIIEPGLYDMTADNAPVMNDMPGYCTITASVPGVSIGKSAYVDDSSAVLQNNNMPIHFAGRDLTIDRNNVVEIWGPTSDAGFHWLDGINVSTSDPAGRYELRRGIAADAFGWFARGYPWVTECAFSKIAGPASRCALVRGCTMEEITYDIATQAHCIVGNSISNHSSEWFNRDNPVFTVRYDGAEAAATLSRSGGASAANAVYTATWGTSTATFVTGNLEKYYLGTDGDGYFFQDVIDWVNSLPGWNASVDDPTFAREVAAGHGSLRQLKGQGFGGGGNQNAPADAKARDVQIVAMFDRHGDFFQHGTGNMENVYCADNLLDNVETQCIFISTTKRPGYSNDMVFINNTFFINPVAGEYYDPAALSSQLGRRDTVASHIVIAHNTFVNQRILIRTDNAGFDLDRYCLIANNAGDRIEFAGAPDGDLAIAGNHLHAGSSVPVGAIGTTIGGDETSLYANVQSGDFRPAGALLTALRPPVVQYDAQFEKRPVLCAAGALA